MGGCRCTYRNCIMKSDGKTHMFHYPVFEKVRCHQWLINAHRLDFLNLKVSQLKNRVVCQYHFKDENFMNFKKDKLTFDAIPTEDGPYCDTTKYVDLNLNSSKLFSIIIDDIENDYIMSNDKKANYSLKYGDFLANLDLMDIEKIDDDSINYKQVNKTNNCISVSTPHKKKCKDRLINDNGSFVYNISLPDKVHKKCETHSTLTVSPYVSNTDAPHNVIQTYELNKSKDKNISTNVNQNNVSNVNVNVSSNEINVSNVSSNVNNVSNVTGSVKLNQQKQGEVKREPNREPKVKIISEKKITDHVPITGKFEPVSPNFVLNISKIRSMKKKPGSENVCDNASDPTENKIPNVPKASKIIEIEIEPLPKEESKPILPLDTPVPAMKNSVVVDKPSKVNSVSLLKPKVPQERVEAINKKRRFNMKLRDVVESCLDKLDKYDMDDEKTIPVENIKCKTNKKRVQFATQLPKNTPILSSQEYTIAFIEARMRKMQDILLEKIEQNSKKIVDLKQEFLKASQEKRSVSLTRVEEENHKKKLFQEISKYLSASSKSVVYEELFLNRLACNEIKTSPKRKRRRCT